MAMGLAKITTIGVEKLLVKFLHIMELIVGFNLLLFLLYIMYNYSSMNEPIKYTIVVVHILYVMERIM